MSPKLFLFCAIGLIVAVLGARRKSVLLEGTAEAGALKTGRTVATVVGTSGRGDSSMVGLR